MWDTWATVMAFNLSLFCPFYLMFGSWHFSTELIMLGGGFKSERLRVNLRLVINRLKLLEKKKSKFGCLHIFLIFGCSKFSWFNWIELAWSELAELAQKARKEIADYLSAGKDERARIRVEHIIREDYLVEAMEILELYCDLLLTRFGLIQSMKWVIFYVIILKVNLFFHPCSLIFLFSFQRTGPWPTRSSVHSHLGCPSTAIRSGRTEDCGYHLCLSLIYFWGVVIVWIIHVFFPSFHRFQISCVPNTAKSMESYAGQTRLEQLMIGYDETCLFRGGGHKI